MSFEVKQSVVTLFRREFKIDSTLLTATVIPGNDISVTNPVTSLRDGDWVQLSAGGDVIKTTGAQNLAWPVFHGGPGFDVGVSGDGTGVTVLQGVYTADTTGFDPLGVYTIGTYLKTNASGLLAPAVTGDAYVAIAEGAPSASSVDAPNGKLSITTFNGTMP